MTLAVAVWLANLVVAAPPDAGMIICPRTAARPTIDGDLNDACWNRAAVVPDFTLPLSEQPPAKAARFWLCFDDQALYVAARCAEPHPDRLRAKAQDWTGDVWQDDCIEIWLRTTNSVLEFDQFIVNCRGARQGVRRRAGSASQVWQPSGAVRTAVGPQEWRAELALPWADLGVKPPTRGQMFQLKLGREDHTAAEVALSTWPPKSRYAGADDYGLLFFEDPNLLTNANMARRKDGKIVAWAFDEKDAALFSSVTDAGKQVIRFQCPGRYSAANQSLQLKPHSIYRLQALVRGSARIYLRARTSERKGSRSRPYTVTSTVTATYQPLEVRFPTGEDGRALIIIGNYEGLGQGEAFIADLRVMQDVGYEADGPALPVPVNAEQPTVVSKLLVTDCRALRGFILAPVDGRLDSVNWNADRWEYNQPGAGAGVGYRYHNNDGLHITLADRRGVDAIQIRGGAKCNVYRDVKQYDDPAAAPLVWECLGRGRTNRVLFPQPVQTDRFSFFDVGGGYLADITFFRLSSGTGGFPAPQRLRVGSPWPDAPIAGERDRRFGEQDRQTFRLGEGGAFALPADRTIHLVTPAASEELPLAAVGLDLKLDSLPGETPMTLIVHDALYPPAELMRADCAVAGPGRMHVILDFPDQILPPGKCLWLSIRSAAATQVSQAAVELYRVPRQRALPEALAYRKLVMKGVFCSLSEARQWMTWRRKMDFAQWARGNRWGPAVLLLKDIVDHCKALAPGDDLVRQYDEWLYQRARRLKPFEPQIDPVPGAPEWAVVLRQAWLTARRVPQWWLDHRLVPTGEFGGLVGDDSDMYQNYADFPMLETGGVAARLKSAADALMELADAENLEHGLNKRTMDPLHAYEEGMNQEALLAWWHYGDPVCFERCLIAARSTEALTVMTPAGHRHFKSQDCGAEDLRIERKTGVDGHAHPLMLHPTFEVAWYNRNPRALKLLRQWADGWLAHMKPGEYATSVEVATEKVTAKSSRPLSGGYGGQSAAFSFLYWITGDTKYLQPFFWGYEAGRRDGYITRVLPELYHRGALDALGEKRNPVLEVHPITRGLLTGDKAPIIEALKRDIAELQRFPDMYTTAEQFTDRIFLHAVTNAAICYTGGYATRNKFSQTHAVSWEGFGTDYAALILAAHPDAFKAILYSFADRPLRGRARFWTLDHGRYRLTLGPDANGDDRADSVELQQELEIQKATAVPLTLPPKQVMVLELQQIERLDDVLQRPDLALSAREIKVTADGVEGIIHNIGARGAPATSVALLDDQGQVRARTPVAALEPPLDLTPRRQPFSIAVKVPPDAKGWRLVADPEYQIPEIYEGNNQVELPTSR